MTKSITNLGSILNMNSRLFINSLENVTDKQANERISDHNNPMIWIATHTVWARYNMCMFLGKPVENPYQGMFEDFKPYDPKENFPSIDEIKKSWQQATEALETAMADATEEQLAQDSPVKSPVGDFTNAGTLAFLVQHESYDIGQMAFLKKYLTKEAMKY
jgi:hypothetical protein